MKVCLLLINVFYISILFLIGRNSWRTSVIFLVPSTAQATHKNGKELAFYTMPQYESWRESLRGNASGWSIKYYKVLISYLVWKERLEFYNSSELSVIDFFFFTLIRGWEQAHQRKEGSISRVWISTGKIFFG